MDYIAGVAALVVLWLGYWGVTRNWNPLGLIQGADGRASSSKLQWLLWTLTVAFSYVVIYAARFSERDSAAGAFPKVGAIPDNLLIVMGISATTMATAKAMTVSHIKRGKVAKTQSDKGNSLSCLIEDDNGTPALNKAQMLGWTLIAVAIYLLGVVEQVEHIHGGDIPLASAGLPNIDDFLMLLMGLSTSAYLGKKYVSTGSGN